MRPVDADWLKSEKVYSHERHEYVVPVYTVDMAKTIEQPHGEWIDETNDALRCSVCGKWVYKPFIGGFPTERTLHYAPNYCAFCGADMRGGENGI